MPTQAWAKLTDLPAESLLQIVSYLKLPASDPFWSWTIGPQTLLPLWMNHDRKSEALHIQTVRRLTQVCRRLRAVYTPVIWANFECKTAVGLRSLQNACAEKSGVGSYIQELELQYPVLPIDTLKTDLEAIWPSLTSLHAITMTLTPTHGCPAWLAAQLTSIPTLSTLRLRIVGNSLGPHLRAPNTLKCLHIELFTPGAYQSPILCEDLIRPSPRASDSAPLFNDVINLVESAHSVTHMGWFVERTLVQAFYRHIAPDPADESDQRCIQVDKLPPNLTRLGVTLESPNGLDLFARTMSRLPITDLALLAANRPPISGTAFKSFCGSFKHLERLRLGIRRQSAILANEVVPEAPHDEVHVPFPLLMINLLKFARKNLFCEGLVSLEHLRCYSGPCKRPSTRSSSLTRHPRLEVESMLLGVTRKLMEMGAAPELLVQLSGLAYGSDGRKAHYSPAP